MPTSSAEASPPSTKPAQRSQATYRREPWIGPKSVALGADMTSRQGVPATARIEQYRGLVAEEIRDPLHVPGAHGGSGQLARGDSALLNEQIAHVGLCEARGYIRSSLEALLDFLPRLTLGLGEQNG